MKPTIVTQKHDYDCGVAVVESILRTYGAEVDRSILERRLQTSFESGTDLEPICQYLSKLGFTCTIRSTSISRLSNLLIDNWVVLNFTTEDVGHYVIAFDINETHVYIMDPGYDKYRKLSLKTLAKSWHSYQEGLPVMFKCLVIDPVIK